LVTPYTPPFTATSSPKTNTFGWRRARGERAVDRLGERRRLAGRGGVQRRASRSTSRAGAWQAAHDLVGVRQLLGVGQIGGDL
jgi:hypothetical protein